MAGTQIFAAFSQGFDFAAVVKGLQKAHDRHSEGSPTTMRSGSATPVNLESACCSSTSGRSTPVAGRSPAGRSSPLVATEPAFSMTRMIPPAIAPMGSPEQLAAVVPMWPLWSPPLPPFQPQPAVAPLPVDPRVASRPTSHVAGAEGPQEVQWRLVWCHERCHKQESVPRRQRLHQTASRGGGAVVCLKKAEKFAGWIGHGQRSPFVLLTDWREAKPCLQALASQAPECRPVCTVILAEDPKQFDRVSAWLDSLPPSPSPVRVFKDESWALNCIVGAMAPYGNNGSPTSGARAQQRDLAAMPTGLAPVGIPPAPRHQAFVAPLGTEILSPLRCGRSATELEALLRSAMPESYDD